MTVSRGMRIALIGGACALALWSVTATALLAARAWSDLEDSATAGAVSAAFRARLLGIEAERDALAARLATAGDDAAPRLGEIAALRVALSAAEAERDALRGEVETARLAAADLQDALRTVARERREIGETLGRLAAALDAAATDRDAARVDATEAEDALETAVADAASLQAREARLLAHIEAVAARGLGSLETVLREAGIDVEGALAGLRGGEGGPFMPVEDLMAAGGGDRVAAALAGLERTALLREAADRLPVAEPIPGNRITSGFGVRRDPFLRRLSRHEGIDFPARIGTPIVAPADGTVSFVGSQRGYGRMVKIRHAFGVETVYAHLSAAKVREGQSVVRGQPVAAVGNTGRSTGPHLHYEVRVDGRPVDPMKFIEAGRHVL